LGDGESHTVNVSILGWRSARRSRRGGDAETAITLDRNLANAYAWLGRCKLAIGSVDEVIPLVEYAIRLSPHDRNLASWYWQIGAVHLLKARAD
jgi:tetratricopeptide (TPR) repeat protein